MYIVSAEDQPDTHQERARLDILENLRESKEYREAFVEESVYATISFQIRAIRENLCMSQKAFGRLVKMAQERVSILEDPNSETRPGISTLLRIANGADCGLEVRFVPMSRILETSFKSGPEDLRVASFAEEDRELFELQHKVQLPALAPSLQNRNGTSARDALMNYQDSNKECNTTPLTRKPPVASAHNYLNNMNISQTSGARGTK